jgi:single-stranded-DNA-specific exonuclease
MIAEAEAEIRERGWQDRPALVLGREGWGHGIVGIVAGRLADRFERPVAVIGFENGHGRGSVRGPRGSRLHDALSRVSQLLVRFGGHQAAAGLEVTIDRLDELREAFEAAVAAQSRAVDAEACGPVLALAAGDSLARVLGDFFLLEPCGEGNPSPELRLEAKLLRAREVSGGHLKLELELDGGQRLGAFGPLLGARAAELVERVVVTGRLRPDRFRGGDAVELRITRLG